ncbi:MAG TPA: DUF1801 domain-containing protein [Cyclobacteriaceae bacterium]|nr:DUF1801 domain-containing protein [Cyclobacteriaceae bacterium]
MARPTNTVDIDQLVAALPRDEQRIVKRLRALVRECIPEATEKAYEGMAMPFYKRNRLICYILPPSVFLEKGKTPTNKRSKGVALGFNQGNLMSNDLGLLQNEGRKQVAVKYFKTVDEIDDKQVRALLFEAAMVDRQFVKKGKK